MVFTRAAGKRLQAAGSTRGQIIVLVEVRSVGVGAIHESPVISAYGFYAGGRQAPAGE